MSAETSFRAALQTYHCTVRETVYLAPMTHVRIGGPAQFLVEPWTEESAAGVVRACQELGMPWRVLGGGSNLLVADAGVKGVVLTLHRLDRLVRDGTKLTAGAGASLPSVLRASRDVGLAGLEVLCGIPALVGGAVAMNAGTRDGQSFDRLVAVTVVDAAGEIVVLDREQLQPRYRDGGLDGKVILNATFDLYQDEPKKILRRFEESLRRRNATQPVAQRSVGCVFQNPPGDAAGRLIDAAGCKGKRCGDVQVSDVHANYFINLGQGTSADFLNLMADVQARVRAQTGIELQPEVRLWQ